METRRQDRDILSHQFRGQQRERERERERKKIKRETGAVKRERESRRE